MVWNFHKCGLPISHFPFRHGFVPKLAGIVGRKIIRSHNNNNEGITIRKAYCMIHRGGQSHRKARCRGKRWPDRIWYSFMGARNGSQTPYNVAKGCAFSPWTRWYTNCDATTKNDRVMKIWRSIFIPIFVNFDELNINYELILYKISNNGLNQNPHAPLVTQY